MSLSVNYCSGATYLLPSTTPSTPGLTPNASSMSSSCSLSSSLSLSTCPSTRPESPTEVRERTIVARKSSRPSLRHMPSWCSFASHVSRRSRINVDMDSDESDEGAYDDAEEVETPGAKDHDKAMSGRGRERDVTGTTILEKRSTRKGGSSGFAKSLKNLSLRHLGSHIERAREGLTSRGSSDEGESDDTRTETPFTVPVQHLLIAHPSDLSPVPVSPTSPDADDYFTPPTIATALLHPHATLPSKASFPTFSRCSSQYARTDWRGISPTPASTPARERIEDATDDTSFPFSIDIFSPRVHCAPVLRGIVDSLPVSPLELPRSQSAFIPSLTKEQFPTSVIPCDSTPSPILGAEINTMPSLGQVVSSYRTSPVQPGSTIFRLPRASIPTSNTAPSIFPTSSFSNMAFARRHSAIIRPPILPSPTPPSLILSPRSLGAPLVPPGPTSPSRLETLAGAPPAAFLAVEAIPDILPSTRIRRVSAAVRVGAISPTAGLGLGVITSPGSVLCTKKKDGELEDTEDENGKKRVPTPATFGLEGEAEKRLVMEGINPYFAY